MHDLQVCAQFATNLWNCPLANAPVLEVSDSGVMLCSVLVARVFPVIQRDKGGQYTSGLVRIHPRYISKHMALVLSESGFNKYPPTCTHSVTVVINYRAKKNPLKHRRLSESSEMTARTRTFLLKTSSYIPQQETKETPIASQLLHVCFLPGLAACSEACLLNYCRRILHHFPHSCKTKKRNCPPTAVLRFKSFQIRTRFLHRIIAVRFPRL